MSPLPTGIFVHYLERLLQLVEKTEASCAGEPAFLQTRLAEDMLPFGNQVRSAAGFALRACCPLWGLKPESFTNDDHTFNGLNQQILQTVAYLKPLSDRHFNLEQGPDIEEQAGLKTITLPRSEFFYLYALPNFFFHLNMAYAIARHAGVPIGKADYDGYHSYPEGFSFER